MGGDFFLVQLSAQDCLINLVSINVLYFASMTIGKWICVESVFDFVGHQ